MASAMPGIGLRAQNVHLNIDVYSLDRTALTSATIYAVTPGQSYCVDAAHVMPAWSGSALSLAGGNYNASSTLAINSVGGDYYVTGNVDRATYNWAIVVVTDAANRCYVLGNANRQKLDTGYFAPDTLLSHAVDGTLNASLNPVTNMIGTVRPGVSDDAGHYYSNFGQAVALCGDYAVLTLMDTVRLTAPVTISRSLTLRQQGKPVVSSCAVTAGGLINIQNSNVMWYGNSIATDIDASAGTGDLFMLDNSMLALRQIGVSAAARPIVANNGSLVSLVGVTLASASANEAVTINDSSSATISTLTVSTPVFAQMGADATGTLTILDSIAAVNAAGIGADAYYRAGNYRKYYRTLSQTAAVANDTVFLARSTAGGDYDTIRNRCVVNLGGNTVRGWLYVDNNTDTVFLLNGNVNYLGGTASATGTLVINGLDSVATLAPQNLNVEILDGRFLVVNPLTGANVTIKGGKYAQHVASYLAPHYAIIPNPDADVVPFTYKVFEGYSVRFRNFNGRGNTLANGDWNDSIVVITTADNRIVPAPSRPTYVGVDTIFSAYFTDTTYTTPWNFLNDVLNSDTVLWAKWYIFNSATDARYTVYHHRQRLDGTYPISFCDTTHGVSALGDSLIVPANVYVGFVPDHDFDTTAALADGAIIEFYYALDSFTVTYRLRGGSFPAGIDTVARYAFGAPVAYPTVTRPGYTFLRWSTNLATMPAFNFSTTAIYNRNTYPLTWSHVDSTAAYSASDVTDVYATYVDNGTTVRALLTITEIGGATVTNPRNVGVYTYTATPVDTNYLLTGNTQTTLVIVPAGVTVSGMAINTAKVYDGNTLATVTAMGTASPVFAGDDVQVMTTARFSDAAIGVGKTITAYFSLTGADAANYALVPPSQVYTTSGAIVAPTVYDVTQGNNGIDVNAGGYCSGDASGVQYYLTSGTPNQYKLTFDQDGHDNGFTDMSWTNITTPGTVDINIPANAAGKEYTAMLILRNSAYPTITSTPIPVVFTVNLSRNYTMPIFSDVISIIDTCHCIDQSSVKWYHNGTYVGDGPYYQEVGGLTGSYHATFNMNGQSKRTCEQTDLVTLVSQAAAATKVVVYPNPVVDRVTVSIENPIGFNHTLRVMNVLGMTLVNTTFDGDETVVDFSGFGIGTYTVSVDGTVVRVIKK